MKWLKTTAQMSVVLCRDLSDVAKGGDGAKLEAATHYSPGLQPCVRQIGTRALPVRHSFALSSEGGKVAPDVCETGGVNTRFPERTPRSPLSGRFEASRNPGLKPWAILYNRCAVKSDNTWAILSDRFMVKNWPESENISNHWKA